MSDKKVLMAMSGGIDSSVAAILLLEQGYELTGVTFRSWDSISENCISKKTGCCDVESLYEAKKIAEKLGFEHHILDVRDSFNEVVVKNFIDEYLAGKTPNPCVICNSYIKWGKLLDFADKNNCRHIATGHYALIKNENNRIFLSSAKDSNKDQTYFLWNLTQDQLSRTLFPLADLTKDDVKKIASVHGFTNLLKKKESQEICFITDNDYRNFLKEHVPGIEAKFAGGNIVSTDGKILGRHKGYPFYTIGQRKGLEYAAGHPMYVVKTDAVKNLVVLGEKSDLEKSELTVSPFNLQKYSSLPDGLTVETKIRYRSKPAEGFLIMKEGKIHITFKHAVSAITPGQSAVFYEKGDLVGGGIILR